MEFTRTFGEFFVIGLGQGKLFEATLSIRHPNMIALNALKSFVDKNLNNFFDENANFNNKGYNALKRRYKSFLD
jgi:hypothetical protein